MCFNYDLFLNLEGNPPVNHLRCEKLTFNNPTHEFRRKLVKAGGVSGTVCLCFFCTSTISTFQWILTLSLSVRMFFLSQAVVIPEGAEMMPRPSPDYPMLPTIPLSAFSDPKKIKSSHTIKVSNKVILWSVSYLNDFQNIFKIFNILCFCL